MGREKAWSGPTESTLERGEMNLGTRIEELATAANVRNHDMGNWGVWEGTGELESLGSNWGIGNWDLRDMGTGH